MTTLDYDAVMVLSFGGPEGPGDVMPFLRNVTRGRNVPDERLAVVAEQYHRFGGRSPINEQCRSLVAALQAELASADLPLPVYWGNRNWHPLVVDTVAAMAADGVRRALVFATSAFGSYSGCRQYREDLERARDLVGPDAPELDKLRLFYNHPGFVEPLAANLRRSHAGPDADLDSGSGPNRRVVFCAHSLPVAMTESCSYPAQLAEAAGLVMERAGLAAEPWDLVYQSRSGPPSVPWLEPDVDDHLVALAAAGVEAVTVVPIGFISDHMEVVFDLDTKAAATAAQCGLGFSRVATVGTDPRFVAMIRELIEERVLASSPLAIGADGPWPDRCPDGHCLAPQRPTRPVA